jgi:uncharacterized membrane protein
MKLSLAFHVIGVCLWLGSLILGGRIMAILSDGPQIPAKATKSVILFTVVGFLVTLVSGVVQIVIQGAPFYFSQGWFHTKLTLVIVLIVLTIILVSHLKSVGAGIAKPKKGLLMMVHGVSSLILIANVFLTVLMGSY